jgi:hypothetical protein
MRNLITAATATAIAIVTAGCAPAVQTGQKTAKTTAHDQETAQYDNDAHARYSAGSGQTFLDTLNRGKEIALAADDLPAIEMTPAATDAQPAQQHNANTGGETRFRIQILASSQVDMVRKEKINAENAVDQPVFMASEQSLFKLYVGEFKTKAEAEAELPKIRKKYPDAWIVNTK